LARLEIYVRSGRLVWPVEIAVLMVRAVKIERALQIAEDLSEVLALLARQCPACRTVALALD
jgi:hypothetical protein